MSFLVKCHVFLAAAHAFGCKVVYCFRVTKNTSKVIYAITTVSVSLHISILRRVPIILASQVEIACSLRQLMYHLWTEKLDMMSDEMLFKYSEYVLCHTYSHTHTHTHPNTTTNKRKRAHIMFTSLSCLPKRFLCISESA